jgi:hypothetical protein
MSQQSSRSGASELRVPTTRGAGPTASAVVAVRKSTVDLLMNGMMMRKKL